jgi:peptidoglycan/xylan/chitin deacetylase (PgdA/CDA1 family)
MTIPGLFVRRSIKSAAALLHRFGVREPQPGSVHILAYHRVTPDIARAERHAYHGLVVSSKTFRRHCELLAEAFTVVSLETAARVIAGKTRSHKPLAVITFDDGYADFYEQAYPVLRELDLTATMFLPTQCIGTGKPLAHDRLYWLLDTAEKRRVDLSRVIVAAGVDKSVADRFSRGKYTPHTESLVYLPDALREGVIASIEDALPGRDAYPPEFSLLDWQQVREMADVGIEFGGHTANHVVLPIEDRTIAREEIFASKADLEAQTGRRVRSFAYPNGQYNAVIRGYLADAGYKTAVTTEKKINRPGADVLALGRLSLCEESTRGITGEFSSSIARMRLVLSN